MVMLKRKRATKEECQKLWYDQNFGPLLRLKFKSFDEYWAEVQRLNNMSDVTYNLYIKRIQALRNYRREENAK